MIGGSIDQYGHPLIEVEVGGIRGTTKVFALVDSGFDGELCLPMEIAVPLGLELSGIETIQLADGSTRRQLLFIGFIRWEEASRTARILLTEADEAMVGTELMTDRCLTIDFRSGEVRIEK